VVTDEQHRFGVRQRAALKAKGETPDAVRIPTGCRFHPRCPLAFDRCRVDEPPLFDVGGGHSSACWLAEGGKALPVLPWTRRQAATIATPAPAAAPVRPAPAATSAAPGPGTGPAFAESAA
jgi:hypothetical protein